MINDGVEEALLERLRRAPAFGAVDGWEVDCAFRRPTALERISLAELATPLERASLCTQRSLVLNRLLWNGYEQSNLYLPSATEPSAREAFASFYDPPVVAASAALRPLLEDACFGFLEREIAIDGAWTVDAFRELTTHHLDAYEAEASQVVARVEQSKNPSAAARLWLIQVAPDFLSEASQMARALPGSYGAVHSELMKLFIDEFGYGVHPKKHSVLFERTLESIGLKSDVHAYYHWYLPTSLLLTSYFYAVTIDKRRFFEYLGALWWIEAVVPHFNRQFRTLLKKRFGDATDTGYFDEHIGIDMHHRRMVLEKLIVPSVAVHGPAILVDVIRGIESARLLGTLADEDFLAQIDFLDGLAARVPGPSASDAEAAHTHTAGGEWLVAPRIADEATTYTVASGAVTVDGGYLAPVTFAKGETFTVPRGRLFGAMAASDGARLEACATA